MKLFLKTNFYAPKFIASHFGTESLYALRRLEKTCKNKLKRKADISFLEKCVLYHLTPKFIRFKLYNTKAQNQRRTVSYRMSLLQFEISQHRKQIKLLEQKIKLLQNGLKAKVGILTWIGVLRFIKASESQEYLSIMKIHHKKLCNLGLDMRNLTGDPNVITNLSNHPLTEQEFLILNKGLKYGILPTHFDFLSTQTTFEKLYHDTRSFLNWKDRIELKRILMNLYSKYKSGFFFAKSNNLNNNLNDEELAALKSLRNNQNLIICKLDKGNGVVVLNKKEYVDKMNEILNDQVKFKKINSDNSLSNLKHFQSFLARLKKKKALSPEDYQRIRPTSTTIPTLYGLPKIHKDNNPMRPFLSSIGSYNHECAAWLSEILTPLRQHTSVVKDTFDFLNDISGLSINNKVMASFDVRSLLTNIPVQFTINLILDQIYEQDVNTFHGLTKTQLKKLLIWSCTGTIFQFNNQIYEQIDGVSMGSPIAPCMADICMNWVLNQASNNANLHQPTL